MRVAFGLMLVGAVGLAGCETTARRPVTSQAASCPALEKDYVDKQRRLDAVVKADPKLRNMDPVLLAVEYEKNPKLKPHYEIAHDAFIRLGRNNCSIERAMSL